MNLQEATDNFTSSLTTAAVNLGSAVNKLQSDWQEIASSNTNADENRRPAATADPVKLIRRIHALEMAASQIQLDCNDMSSRRATAVQDAVKEMQKNRRICQKLSKALHLEEEEDDEDDAVLQKELEVMILEQGRLLSLPSTTTTTTVQETPRRP